MAEMVPYSIFRLLEIWNGKEFTNMKSIDKVAWRMLANNDFRIHARIVFSTVLGFFLLVFPCKAGIAGPKISLDVYLLL